MDTFQVLTNNPYRRCMLILNNGDNTCVDRSLSLIQLDPQGSHPGQQWPWEGRCPKGENVFCPLWSFVTRMKSWNHFRSHICLTSLVGIMWEWQSDRAHLFIPARGKTFPKISQSVPGRVQVIFGKGSTFYWCDFQQLKTNYNPFQGPLSHFHKMF